jgi:hypothetical protein
MLAEEIVKVGVRGRHPGWLRHADVRQGRFQAMQLGVGLR